MINAEKSDVFDVLAYIAFDREAKHFVCCVFNARRSRCSASCMCPNSSRRA